MLTLTWRLPSRPFINRRVLTRHIRLGYLGPSRAAGSHVLAEVSCITLSDQKRGSAYYLRLSFTELRLLNLITCPLTETVTAHAPCHVTITRGQNGPHFSLTHFVTFRALRRRLNHVIGENSVYPIEKATKFSAHAQYHVTCA